ncbi:mannosyltransferase [Actinoplanes octamycinicus]|uniref:Mannosyltransferase n=1 Tax=Actinoplanes octamycinicus TaxID=135948 RepID=A0A7W7GZS3_9ACTN|nr:glycosyltransferase family 39 protein [Actinoplanes octamycinicus]MBB4741237.1 mannosyltransferase [Actinoplanes octamycinicus]
MVTPYYAAMKLWTTVAGTGTPALRLPSALAIAGTAILVAVIGRRTGGERTGLAGGLLFAAIPAVSRYAQEARPYAIAMFFAALALWCLLRIIARPAVGGAAGYAAAVAATGLAHPLGGLLMVAGHALVVRRLRWWWAVPAAVGSVPAVLLAVAGAGQSGQVSWIPVADLNTWQGLPQTVFGSAAIGGMVIVLAVLGVRWDPAFRVLAGAAFVPPVLLLMTGMVYPIWVARYVLVALAPMAVLAASGLLRAGRVRAGAVVALALLVSFPVQLELREPAGHAEDSTKIAQVIGPRYRPGDVAVFPDTHPSIPWAPRDIYQRYLPAPRPPDVLATRPQRADGRLLARECPAAACLGDPPRIWVIRVDDASDPLRNMAPGKRQRISRDYRAVSSWKYPLLSITLLERRG